VVAGRFRCWEGHFSGTAFASHEYADALEHLGGRACSLGQEDVCAACAVIGGDGAGDDHGGKAGVELFGAANELVPIHLRHDEIAEEEVDGPGK